MKKIIFALSLFTLTYSLPTYAQLKPIEGFESKEMGIMTPMISYENSELQGLYVEKLESWMAKATEGNLKEKIGKELKSNDCGNVAFDPAAVTLCGRTGNFDVTYTGFTPEAQAAFQYALDIWSRVIDLPVPVKADISFVNTGNPNNLGGSFQPWIWNLMTGVSFPSALADQLIGADIHTLPMWNTTDPWYDAPDIRIVMNSSRTDWYFGLDGCLAPNQQDFVSTAIHEIGHGLGFFSRDRHFPAGTPIPELGNSTFAVDIECFGSSGGFPPYVFDQFIFSPQYDVTFDILNGICFGGQNILTNNDLLYVGPNGIACNGGAPVPLFSPGNYLPGSSTSHWDEATFPGPDPDFGAQTPFGGFGEAIHDPGCTLAALRDIGYTTADEVPLCEVVPTMGEWGLMSLGLLLLILGVVTIKSRKLVFG